MLDIHCFQDESGLGGHVQYHVGANLLLHVLFRISAKLSSSRGRFEILRYIIRNHPSPSKILEEALTRWFL